MNDQELSELLSVLEIKDDIKNVTIRNINVAFRRLARQVHPDKASEEQKEEKTEAFKKLRAAYEKLKKFLLEKPAEDLIVIEDENDEDVFFKDNFEKFNFPYENQGSFTVTIEDYLADTWQEFIANILGEPKVVINPWGTECDRSWKVHYADIDITIHLYNKPKNKKGSKLMLQGRRQSVLCSYVFEELPKIYKLVRANRPQRIEATSRKPNTKPSVKCEQCKFKSTLVQMKMHIKTVHATKPKKAHKRLSNFTPLSKPS